MKNEKKDTCKSYLQSAENDRLYYDIFFQMCRKFQIDWASASEKEKEFIKEVVRVTYERNCAERKGSWMAAIRPAFTA